MEQKTEETRSDSPGRTPAGIGSQRTEPAGTGPQRGETSGMEAGQEAEALRAIREYEARVGIRTVAAEPGYAEAVMECKPSMFNPAGTVHGGWLFTLADSTGGIAANAYGQMVVTLDSSFHFLRTAQNCQMIHAYATEIKHGRRAMVFSVSVRDEKGTELAVGIFTYMPFDTSLMEDLKDRRK